MGSTRFARRGSCWRRGWGCRRPPRPMVATAVQLSDELADTVTALSRGELDYGKAAALAVGVRALDPPDGCADPMTGEVITPMGSAAAWWPGSKARVLPQGRGPVMRNTATPSPAPSPRRAADGRAETPGRIRARRVEFRSEADGMAWLSVYGPAVDLIAVKVMLDAAAEAAKAINPDDPRTYDQIRVDTLTELAWAILETRPPPRLSDSTRSRDDRSRGDTSRRPRRRHHRQRRGRLRLQAGDCAAGADAGG